MRLWYFSSSITHFSNAHAQPYSRDKCLIFGWTLCLLPYFICANSEGSGETALCTALPESLLDAYAITTIISWAGSFNRSGKCTGGVCRMQKHPCGWRYYFKTMQCFTGNRVYTLILDKNLFFLQQCIPLRKYLKFPTLVFKQSGHRPADGNEWKRILSYDIVSVSGTTGLCLNTCLILHDLSIAKQWQNFYVTKN